MGPITYLDIDFNQVAAFVGNDDSFQLPLDASNDLFPNIALFESRLSSIISTGEPLMIADLMSEYERVQAEPQDQLSTSEQSANTLKPRVIGKEQEVFFNPPRVHAHPGGSGEVWRNSIDQLIFNAKTIPIPTASMVEVEDGIVGHDPDILGSDVTSEVYDSKTRHSFIYF
jgi:hypothetical protein